MEIRRSVQNKIAHLFFWFCFVFFACALDVMNLLFLYTSDTLLLKKKHLSSFHFLIWILPNPSLKPPVHILVSQPNDGALNKSPFCCDHSETRLACQATLKNSKNADPAVATVSSKLDGIWYQKNSKVFSSWTAACMSLVQGLSEQIETFIHNWFRELAIRLGRLHAVATMLPCSKGGLHLEEKCCLLLEAWSVE